MKYAGIAMAVIVLLAGTVMAEDEPKIKGKPLSKWIKQLTGANRGLQVRAARALSGAPAELREKIVPKLIPLLSSERENDRFVAAQVLGDYGPTARVAVPALLPLLKGTQFERNRAAAATALGQILKDAKPDDEVEKVAQALIAVFADQYSDVRREAVKACGMIGPAAKSCIPKLTTPLTQGSHGLGSSQDQEYRLVRRAAAWTCGRMGTLSKQHIDLLISRMHLEGEYCVEVVEAIGLIGPVHENVVPNIVDKIESTGRPGDAGAFRTKAFEALGRFGDKSLSALPLVKRILMGPAHGNEVVTVKIAMLRFLAALGPSAKGLEPEIKAQLKFSHGAFRNDLPKLKEEATKAYKAVTGKEPPAE